MERSGELHLNELPEGCIANALSFTAPLDVARLSAVSPMFKSAAISDVVWERFLPSDLESVLSTSPDGSLLLASVSSKRELYFSLCDNPILVDNGRKVKRKFPFYFCIGPLCLTVSARLNCFSFAKFHPLTSFQVFVGPFDFEAIFYSLIEIKRVLKFPKFKNL